MIYVIIHIIYQEAEVLRLAHHQRKLLLLPSRPPDCEFRLRKSPGICRKLYFLQKISQRVFICWLLKRRRHSPSRPHLRYFLEQNEDGNEHGCAHDGPPVKKMMLTMLTMTITITMTTAKIVVMIIMIMMMTMWFKWMNECEEKKLPHAGK